MNKILVKKTRCGLPVYYPEAPITGYCGKDGESLEAQSFYDHVMFNNPDIGMMLFHVTNEGKRSYKRGEQLKRSGLIKGVADYIMLVPAGCYHFLVIELKREDGGSGADKDQRAFLHGVNARGGYGCVANGYHAALHVVGWYLGLNKKNDKKVK